MVEDNGVILMTIVEYCRWHKLPLYACFMDLQGAYDHMDHLKLFTSLLESSSIDRGTIHQLLQLYSHVATTVFAGGDSSTPFEVR